MNLLPTLLPILQAFTLILLTTAAPVTTPSSFNLITSSANPTTNALFLSTQSTDPLNSNPVFRDPSSAATFHLTNTTVNYEAPNGAPWALALVNGDTLQGDVEVSVSPSVGSAVSTGFRIGEHGELEVQSVRWGGWLVCPGQGTPLLELFYEDTTEGVGVPGGCDQVQLNAVFKSS